jgi:hypothetical protein
MVALKLLPPTIYYNLVHEKMTSSLYAYLVDMRRRNLPRSNERIETFHDKLCTLEANKSSSRSTEGQ